MGESPKSYYQVSFTGTQALVALLVLLGALALSFFLGAKAGFTRTRVAAHEAPAAALPAEPGASSASEAAPPATSAAAPAPATPAAAATSAASSTGPIVAPTFEDREAGLPEETAPPSSEIRTSEPSPSRTVIAGSSSASPPKTSSKPAPAAAAHEPAKAETRDGAKPARFYVQVLSTSSRSEAGRWKDRLSAKKYKASVSPVETKKGKLFRVRVGPYADKEQAKKIAAKISGEEKRQAWVAPAE